MYTVTIEAQFTPLVSPKVIITTINKSPKVAYTQAVQKFVKIWLSKGIVDNYNITMQHNKEYYYLWNIPGAIRWDSKNLWKLHRNQDQGIRN